VLQKNFLLPFQSRLILLILALSFQTAWYCMIQNILLRTFLSVLQRVVEIEGSLVYKLSGSAVLKIMLQYMKVMCCDLMGSEYLYSGRRQGS
jgi:hypothetical protein